MPAGMILRSIVPYARMVMVSPFDDDWCLPLAKLKSNEKVFLHRFKDIVEKVVSPLCKAHHQHINSVGGGVTQSSSDLLAKDKLITSANALLQYVAKYVHDSWDVG